MTKPDLFNGMSKILNYINHNSGYMAFSALDQLAKYTDGLKNVNIKAYNTTNDVVVDITTTKQIDKFTFKLTNIGSVEIL